LQKTPGPVAIATFATIVNPALRTPRIARSKNETENSDTSKSQLNQTS